MSTIAFSTVLTPITCPKCAGVYAISETYRDNARELGEFKKCWTCPYCKTTRGYGKGTNQLEKQKLEADLRAAQGSVEFYARRAKDARAEADHFRKSRDGFKGVLAKQKKRIANGVCPCCTRSFTNLRRHMATMHPEHGATAT